MTTSANEDIGPTSAMGSWRSMNPKASPTTHTLVVDESLRDGLQSPSVRNPHLDEKRELIHAMGAIGVDVVSIGLPAASTRAVDDAAALLKEISDARLPIRATAAARTTEADVAAIAEVSQRGGASVEVYAFIGSSPIRHYTEAWSDDFLVQRVAAAAKAAERAGLPFCLVTEDTTRASPSVLSRLWAVALDSGASRLCLCDTVGHAEPSGVEALVGFARNYLDAHGAQSVELDWHGHEDRGLALANALTAANAGVERIHGTALGVGERVGNVAMEPLLYNLGLAGRRPRTSLSALRHYSDLAARSFAFPISTFAPLVGERSRSLDEARTARCALAQQQKTEARATVEPPLEEGWMPIRLRLNGDNIEHMTRPSRTLLEMLRYDLDLVGTRQGCDKGDCGACTVLIDGEPHLSCITLAASCDERSITTVESLKGPPDLDPLLDAFDRCAAGQCGFCTPGMLMTATALLRKHPRPSRDTIKRALSGNLCRCTGYGAIFDAIDLAAKIRAGEEPPGVGLPGEHVPPPLAPQQEKAPTKEKAR
ncbi:MAG: 2Fe-2S iron-sulfur cluster binding domain-containing protein [Polyangiaceae bacterium]|nr:2Fe-2S iron-sulfur cluster binding domain-containing protein [Polyangiaceae bacterium]